VGVRVDFWVKNEDWGVRLWGLGKIGKKNVNQIRRFSHQTCRLAEKIEQN